jgi:hypothetical protein
MNDNNLLRPHEMTFASDAEAEAFCEFLDRAKLMKQRAMTRAIRGAKAVADEQANERRRKGGTSEEIEDVWCAWFGEELSNYGYRIERYRSEPF